MARKTSKQIKINGHHANLHRLDDDTIIADVYITTKRGESRLDWSSTGGIKIRNYDPEIKNEYEKVIEKLKV